MEEVRAMCTSPLSLQGVVWEGGGRGTGNARDVIVSLSLQGVVRVGCGTYKDVLYLISGTGEGIRDMQLIFFSPLRTQGVVWVM